MDPFAPPADPAPPLTEGPAHHSGWRLVVAAVLAGELTASAIQGLNWEAVGRPARGWSLILLYAMGTLAVLLTGDDDIDLLAALGLRLLMVLGLVVDHRELVRIHPDSPRNAPAWPAVKRAFLVVFVLFQASRRSGAFDP
ncbi:MAG: hypothetical protein R3F59_06270 [Myxococcota bacterium]